MSQIISLDQAQLLSSIDLFKGLDRVALAQLVARLERVGFSRGDLIVCQGAPGDSLYILAGGSVEVVVRTAGGAESVVNRQSPGEYFGEMALLTDAPRSATVRAREDCVVLRLDRKGFMGLIEKQPRMAGTIIATISERLRRSDSARVASETALEQVVRQFLDELPAERRSRLLQVSLLDDPTPDLLGILLGPNADGIWSDLLRASANSGRPAARVVALLRQRLFEELGEQDARALTIETAECLARGHAWAAALSLAARCGQAELVGLLGRALRDIPAPAPEDIRPWLEGLTDDEALSDVEIALARAHLYRLEGNDAAAASIERRAAGRALSGGVVGSGRLAEVLAGIVQSADETTVLPQAARRHFHLASPRGVLLFGAAAALVAGAIAAGHEQLQLQFLLLLCAAIVLWVGQVAADSFISLGLLVFWVLLGIAKPQQALAGFGSSTWIFVFAVLALATAVAPSGLLFRVGLLLIRRMPKSLFGQSATLALSGMLLTPLLPMELEDREPRAATLGLSAWIGSTPLTFMFLNGAPITLLAWGLLPVADQARFNWFYWMVAALPLGLIVTFGTIALLFLLFRPKKVTLPPRAKLDLELAVLGKAGKREMAMMLVLTIAGWAAAAPLGLDVGIVAVAGLLAAVATGNLSAQNLKELDWNFLVFFGAALSLGGVAVALGLDKSAGRLLQSVLGFTNGSALGFIFVIALVGIGAQMVISKSQAVLLLSLVLLPVAASFGINPWIAAIVILAASSMWYYRAQTSSYALAWSITEGRLFSENQGRAACMAFTAALFAGLGVSVPYWHALGLL